jgi:phenylacetate-CoA ligase
VINTPPAVQARPQLGQWAGPEELRELQARQLPRLLARASHSPFYRSQLAGPGSRDAMGTFASLPLTTKDDLRQQYPFGLLAVPKEELATYHESSGTAGMATPGYYTDRDWEDLAERYARKWVGIGPSDTFLVRTPYALMITGHLAHAAARMRGATVVPADLRTRAMPLARVIRLMHDLEVTLTWSNPTQTLLWAAAARAAGYQPDKDFPALRALFVAAEPLTAARRRRITEIWGVPVVEEYGATETGTLAGQCSAGQLHLWADRAVFEVYSPQSGQISAEGRGQLVVTPLYRDAMPLLRYNLADDVEVSYGGCDCDCGWRLPTVRVFGRSAVGHRVQAGVVTQQQLEELVFSLPQEYDVMFWRARAEPSVLRVQMEVSPGWREQAIGELTAAIGRALGVPCEVAGLPPGTIVPHDLLTTDHDVLKPRSLLGPGEEWDDALIYL